MKRRKLVLAAMIAAMAVPSLSAMAYDGDILTITADSDGDPFSWDTSTDKLAAMIEDKFGIDFQQSETNYYNNDFTVTQLAAVDGTLPDVLCRYSVLHPGDHSVHPRGAGSRDSGRASGQISADQTASGE